MVLSKGKDKKIEKHSMEDNKHTLLYCLRARERIYKNTTKTTLTTVRIASIFFGDKARGTLHINTMLRKNLTLVFADIFRSSADYVLSRHPITVSINL